MHHQKICVAYNEIVRDNLVCVIFELHWFFVRLLYSGTLPVLCKGTGVNFILGLKPLSTNIHQDSARVIVFRQDC